MKHSASKLKLLSLKCDYAWSFLFQKIIWWIAVSVQLISQDNFFLNLKIAPTDFKTRKSIICQSSCMNPSVISQKGESQNRCFKKTKHAKFTKKRTFLTPWYSHLPVWDSPFCLITEELPVFTFFRKMKINLTEYQLAWYTCNFGLCLYCALF